MDHAETMSDKLRQLTSVKVKMLDKTGNFASVYIFILSNTTTAITAKLAVYKQVFQVMRFGLHLVTSACQRTNAATPRRIGWPGDLLSEVRRCFQKGNFIVSGPKFTKFLFALNVGWVAVVVMEPQPKSNLVTLALKDDICPYCTSSLFPIMISVWRFSLQMHCTAVFASPTLRPNLLLATWTPLTNS